MADEDTGQGDESMYSAEDLEQLYRRGTPVPTRIQGKALNALRGVTTYDPDAWYLVTLKGVLKVARK